MIKNIRCLILLKKELLIDMTNIKNIREYEKFLHAHGFSVREAKILSRSWRDLKRPTFWENIKAELSQYVSML